MRRSLEPRTTLLENKLSEEMHVSRAAVTESMQRLAVKGFIKNNP